MNTEKTNYAPKEFTKMRFDMHVHVGGHGLQADDEKNRDDFKKNINLYFNEPKFRSFFIMAEYYMMERDLASDSASVNDEGKVTTDAYLEYVYKRLVQSKEIDSIVLLAMDAPFKKDKDGQYTIDWKHADLLISNKFLSDKVDYLNCRLKCDGRTDKRFFMAASIHPLREDFLAEMTHIINNKNVVAVKIIPSEFNLDLSSFPPLYWKILAGNATYKDFQMAETDEIFSHNLTLKLPLILHTGPEYCFEQGTLKPELNMHEDLKLILKAGVRLIAAHCGARVFPTDKNHIDNFLKLLDIAHSDNNNWELYGDISGFTFYSRLNILKKLAKQTPYHKYLLNGTDIPVPVYQSGWTYKWNLIKEIFFNLWRKHVTAPHHHYKFDSTIIAFASSIFEQFVVSKKASTIKNVFDRDVAIKRSYGFLDNNPDNIYTNAGSVLRDPAEVH
ncbi:MAG: hypothetical protein NT007_09190 [Candidatus Kapabacteria bacterium]|nr:hypothetical protein [Candidatus Kapabacteria bacterium]